MIVRLLVITMMPKIILSRRWIKCWARLWLQGYGCKGRSSKNRHLFRSSSFALWRLHASLPSGLIDGIRWTCHFIIRVGSMVVPWWFHGGSIMLQWWFHDGSTMKVSRWNITTMMIMITPSNVDKWHIPCPRSYSNFPLDTCASVCNSTWYMRIRANSAN